MHMDYMGIMLLMTGKAKATELPAFFTLLLYLGGDNYLTISSGREFGAWQFIAGSRQ